MHTRTGDTIDVSKVLLILMVRDPDEVLLRVAQSSSLKVVVDRW